MTFNFAETYDVAAAESPQSFKYTTSTIICNVNLLDSNQVSFKVDKGCRGQNILDLTFDYLELLERDFFGLVYQAKGRSDEQSVQKWLDPSKKIRKLFSNIPPYVFWFRVKFYVPDPICLNEEYTRYQFALQLRRDLIEGQIIAPKEVAAQLTGLVLQAELGDYDEQDCRPGYVARFPILPHNSSDFETLASEWHRKYLGMVPASADSEFLNIVRTLENYGVRTFEATVTKTPSSTNLPPLTKTTSARHSRTSSHSVSNSMSHEVDLQQNKSFANKPINYAFTLPNAKLAKYVWQYALACHAFFRVTEPGSGGNSSSPTVISATAIHSVVSRITSSFRRVFSFKRRGRSNVDVGSASSKSGGMFDRTLSTIVQLRSQSRSADRVFSRSSSVRSNSNNTSPGLNRQTSSNTLTPTSKTTHGEHQQAKPKGKQPVTLPPLIPHPRNNPISSSQRLPKSSDPSTFKRYGSLPSRSRKHATSNQYQHGDGHQRTPSPSLPTKHHTESRSPRSSKPGSPMTPRIPRDRRAPSPQTVVTASGDQPVHPKRRSGGVKSPQPPSSRQSTDRLSSNTALSSVDQRATDTDTVVGSQIERNDNAAAERSTRHAKIARSTSRTPEPSGDQVSSHSDSNSDENEEETIQVRQLQQRERHSSSSNHQRQASNRLRQRSPKPTGKSKSARERLLESGREHRVDSTHLRDDGFPRDPFHPGAPADELVSNRISNRPSPVGQPDLSELVCIRLRPDSQGRFGFNVRGTGNAGDPIVVSRVGHNMPADMAIPRLWEGDRLVEVNRRLVDGHSHAEIVNWIREASSERTSVLELLVLPGGNTVGDNVGETVRVRDSPITSLQPPRPYSSSHHNHHVHVKTLQPPSRPYPPPSKHKHPVGQSITIQHQANHQRGELDTRYKKPRHFTSSIEFEHPDALDKSIAVIVEGLRDESILTEFERIPDRMPNLPVKTSRLSRNLLKNRYRDISLYDHTRVILEDGKNDYINASHVVMDFDSPRVCLRYIAAQGPLSSTSVDFWQMCWEQRTNLLVMLTAVSERGRVKCHQYWPELDESMYFPLTALYNTDRSSITTFVVRNVEEQVSTEFAYRRFTLTAQPSNITRQIHHYHYISWPDYGVPTSCDDLLTFIDKLDRHRQSTSSNSPMVVHCSAGVGRTGVLICLETAFALMRKRQPIRPLEMVNMMRNQRPMMVHTVGQFKFICETIIKVYRSKCQMITE